MTPSLILFFLLRPHIQSNRKPKRPAILKVWFGTAWQSPRPFQKICEVKDIFIIVQRDFAFYTLIFTPVLSGVFHHCTVMFSDIIALMAHEMCTCVFLCLKSISVLIFYILNIYRYYPYEQTLFSVLNF